MILFYSALSLDDPVMTLVLTYRKYSLQRS